MTHSQILTKSTLLPVMRRVASMMTSPVQPRLTPSPRRAGWE